MKRGALPLNALRAFESTARLGTMSEAASELNVTHSAVSRQIRGLEQKLGIRLFEGPRNRLMLSEAAKTLLPPLTLALDSIHEAVDRVATQKRNVIDVSSLATLTMRWLIPRLFDFHDQHPEIEIRLTSDDGPVDFRRSTLDVAIRVGAKADESIEATPLIADRVGPVLSPAALPDGGISDPRDLEGLIFLHTRTRPWAWQHWCSDMGVEIDTSGREFEHFYFLLEAATAGLGAAMAPEILVRDDVAAGRLVAPFGFRPNGLHYMALTEKRAPAAVRTFVRWLVEKAREDGLSKPSRGD